MGNLRSINLDGRELRFVGVGEGGGEGSVDPDLLNRVEQLENTIGDISAALARIIAMQESYIAQSPAPVSEGVV